jgi:hypothetical protein
VEAAMAATMVAATAVVATMEEAMAEAGATALGAMATPRAEVADAVENQLARFVVSTSTTPSCVSHGSTTRSSRRHRTGRLTSPTPATTTLPMPIGTWTRVPPTI